MSEHPVGKVVHEVSSLATQFSVAGSLHGLVVERVEQPEQGAGAEVSISVGSGERVFRTRLGFGTFQIDCGLCRGPLEFFNRDEDVACGGLVVPAATCV